MSKALTKMYMNRDLKCVQLETSIYENCNEDRFQKEYNVELVAGSKQSIESALVDNI